MSTQTTNDTTLPAWFGKTPIQRIVTVYAILWHDVYGTKYFANYGMVGKLFKPLLETFDEWQIAALMVMHFEWAGATGDNSAIQANLEANMYPIQWIPSRINEYITYLTNVKLVNFSNPQEIKEWTKSELRNAHAQAVRAGIVRLAKPEAGAGDSHAVHQGADTA